MLRSGRAGASRPFEHIQQVKLLEILITVTTTESANTVELLGGRQRGPTLEPQRAADAL
ncbi:hypothetical protein ACWGA9_26690 [Streptomyces sp. NPDC054950]